MSTVWFMVDDTDTTSLAYSEPHSNFAIASTKTFNATRGPAYNNTLHSTTHKASITFNFNGTSFFGVYGSLDMVKPLGTLPDITCSLDGFPTSSPQYSYDVGTANNNYLACFANSDVLSQNLGEHELVIDITNSVNSTWFFDYLTYESLPNPILNGEMLQAGNQQLIPSANYSMLSFGPGWVNQEQDDSIETNVVGSEVTINFNGTQLALYGDLNSNVSNTAPYQVDERAPVGFEIQGSGTSSTLTNTALFNTDLSIEEHKVVVTFNGSTSGNPLDINYFLITSLTQAEQASLPGSSSSGVPSSSATSLSPNVRTKTKVTVGAVVGPVLAVIVLAALGTIFWYRRRSAQRRLLLAASATPFRQEASVTITNADIASESYHYQNMYWDAENPSTTYPGSSSGYGYNDREADVSNASEALTMKPQQQLDMVEDQLTEAAEQGRQPTVHVDSGLRIVGTDRGEVPPRYTES